MRKKYLLAILFVSAFLLGFVAETSAFTGRLGNARMVLRLAVGEVRERYLIVENPNEIPIDVELKVEGDLVENLVLREANFSLQPGEKKNAYFTVKSDEAGTFETNINVFFKQEDGPGIASPATIIVLAEGESSGDEDQDNDSNTDDDNGFNLDFGNNNDDSAQDGEGQKMSPFVLLLVLSIVLILALVILIVYANKNSKKRPRRPRA